MCGIFFTIQQEQSQSSSFLELCQALERVNGARGPDAQRTRRISLSDDLILNFFGSELLLRGTTDVVQPHEANGNIFCWNGEVFEGVLDIGQDENDGVKLFEKLSSLDSGRELCDLFGNIEGPYAFVYYSAKTRRLFFGRDPLGRRSLLIHKPTPENPYLLLASTSIGRDTRYDFQELPTEHICCLELGLLGDRDLVNGLESYWTIFNRASTNAPYTQPPRICEDVPSDDLPLLTSLETPNRFEEALQQFLDVLDTSVALRVRNIPKLPEAGAARLAVLFSGGVDSTVIAFLADKYIPVDEPIDLLNVAFENPRKIRLQKEERNKGIGGQEPPPYMVPDRETGLQELEELRKLRPHRRWNFVEINVPYEESRAAQTEIEAVMFPARTVMDLSLAMALFFASRGRGVLGDEVTPYQSRARVLLNGLGADELLGGYSRHKSIYKVKGWKALIEELQLDIDRIPTRNLGRDDRVISGFGKEMRHPFLSLSLVDFVARLPVHLKMDPRGAATEGDKALLRLAARRLGLVEASQRKKRAMQFGSRSARMEGEKHGDTLLEG
ncbi:Asparagine synthetase domain-containing protein 1 [Mycena indigotica]|uniref:Asparagine synthetase domain-containing protein 1 n=1 Tax=Mycena indigotica TaxID=2126181 RepID=A0A8H6SWG4_9AGAR|nr:Asparagine synthetase domain-containing protein 1 [Mycena indigotica]KAF7306696.1 Asparagine synthetase domain-containing protein 1 [Mycena indigotica]